MKTLLLISFFSITMTSFAYGLSNITCNHGANSIVLKYDGSISVYGPSEFKINDKKLKSIEIGPVQQGMGYAGQTLNGNFFSFEIPAHENKSFPTVLKIGDQQRTLDCHESSIKQLDKSKIANDERSTEKVPAQNSQVLKRTFSSRRQ